MGVLGEFGCKWMGSTADRFYAPFLRAIPILFGPVEQEEAAERAAKRERGQSVPGGKPSSPKVEALYLEVSCRFEV